MFDRLAVIKCVLTVRYNVLAPKSSCSRHLHAEFFTLT